MAQSQAEASQHHRQSAFAPGDWIAWLLGNLAYCSAIRPRSTLALASIITCLAAALACAKLEFRTSRLDLLSDSASYNQRWLSYLERFGNDDDAVVVVSHTDSAQVSAVLSSIGNQLESDPQLTGVLYRKSVGNVATKALHLLPTAELQQLDQLLLACLQMLAGPTNLPQIAQLSSSQLSDIQLSNAQLSNIQAPLAALTREIPAALTQAQRGLDQLQQAVPSQGPLLLEDEGRLGICLVRLPHLDDKPVEAQAGISRLNHHLEKARAAHPGVDLWLTGMPVLEWDESRSSQRDMQNATLLSLAGVAVIFIFGFGSWRMPVAAVVCLAVGLTWTVGLATLTIGHLNLFSVAFGAIIAGLGIDYAIHLLTRLRSELTHFRSDELPEAIRQAVGHCGKGVATGAITTAAAFGVAVLTPFKGMTELGLICALGTLSCMVVTLWLLPALLVLQAQWLPERTPGRSESASRSWFDLAGFQVGTLHCLRMCNTWTRQQRTMVLICIALLTLLSGSQLGRLSYDHNLLNLQADDVPSVHAERELTRRSGQSAWFAITMAASPQQALALHRRLESLPSVARVEEIGSVIASAAANPHTSQQVATCRLHARQLVQQITYAAAQQMASAADARQSPGDPNQLLGDGPLVQLVSHSRLPNQNDFSNPVTSGQFASHHASLAVGLPLDSQLTSQMQLLAQTVEAIAGPEPPALGDFPESVRSRMASIDGKTFLLRIFAKDNLWQRENLEQFVKEIESVDPRVTGHPVQTWYASGELERSYYQAGIYAFLLVLALLMIDLGSVRLVALAMVPVCVSLMQLCGLLVALRIPFNAANMIVLPLIIGIGIDDGVHIMHDFRTRGRRTFSLSADTTLAVLLTSLTTMIGFGCMGIAEHRGLQSLGIVLLLGVGLCLLNSWFTLPALLSYFGSHELEADGTHEVFQATQSVTSDRDTSELYDEVLEDSKPSGILLLNDIPIVLSLPDYLNMPL